MSSTAVSDWVDAAIALGRSEHALGRLEALVAADPLRERLRWAPGVGSVERP